MITLRKVSTMTEAELTEEIDGIEAEHSRVAFLSEKYARELAGTKDPVLETFAAGFRATAEDIRG